MFARLRVLAEHRIAIVVSDSLLIPVANTRSEIPGAIPLELRRNPLWPERTIRTRLSGVQ